MPRDLGLLSTLNGSNYSCLELIFMVPKMVEPLKFDCITIVIQHNLALGTTASRAICDVKGNDYYLYASRRDLMLEIGYFHYYMLNSVC